MITRDPSIRYRVDGSIDVDYYFRRGRIQIYREVRVSATRMREALVASFREGCENVAALVAGIGATIRDLAQDFGERAGDPHSQPPGSRVLISGAESR